jgi:hypothetical protein
MEAMATRIVNIDISDVFDIRTVHPCSRLLQDSAMSMVVVAFEVVAERYFRLQ